jgi:hypothetical protein
MHGRGPWPVALYKEQGILMFRSKLKPRIYIYFWYSYPVTPAMREMENPSANAKVNKPGHKTADYDPSIWSDFFINYSPPSTDVWIYTVLNLSKTLDRSNFDLY